MDYPIWDVGIGGGLLMALVAIPHVIVSHFAIGGGLVIAVTETLAVRRRDPAMRDLARRGSLMLILVSTVFGAISGVGIWVVAGLISPGAISALIHTYVWGWAIEWTFFIVEIVAALVYYATWNRVSKGAHLTIGWIYFVAAYLSLVIINGIITFMLTPGRWLETRAFWDGFFNPTYWPGLLLRTGICALMASVFLLFVAGRSPRDQRPRLIRYLAGWLTGGALVAYAGYRWWEASLPETVLALFRGEHPLLPTLASTRSLTLWALTVALALGGLALMVAPRAGRVAVAVVVAAAAFTSFGGYERLREGARKPFLIHGHLFSNGLLVDEIERINVEGLKARSGWVALRSTDGIEAHGREVFRGQCASCHTLDRYQAIRPLLPSVDDVLSLAADDPPGAGQATFDAQCASCHVDRSWEDLRDALPTPQEIRDDPDYIREMNRMMIAATLDKLHEMGAAYVEAASPMAIDTRALRYPQMPPLVGNDEDVHALAAWLTALDGGDLAPGGTPVARRGGTR